MSYAPPVNLGTFYDEETLGPVTTVGTLPTGAKQAAVLAEFEAILNAADKCPCCDMPLPGDVFGYGIPVADAYWVTVDPARFGLLTSHAHSLWTDYVTHQAVQELHNGWLRIACPSANAAGYLRSLLLGYGLPAVAVWTGVRP